MAHFYFGAVCPECNGGFPLAAEPDPPRAPVLPGELILTCPKCSAVSTHTGYERWTMDPVPTLEELRASKACVTVAPVSEP